MSKTKEYCIDIEMTDGGKLITSDKSTDFVYKYLVRLEVMKTQEKVSGLICFDHHNFPIIEPTISKELIVIRIRCCCEKFLNLVDQRYHGQ
jgi:hypothetical protein